MSGRLNGKVAVVTGASGGIGAAIALALVTEGASVALGARRIEALEGVKAEIASATGAGDRVTLAQTDVTKREQVQALVAAAEQAFGPVDILVNNAGVMPYELIKHVNQDSWDRTVDINCKGVLNGVGAVLPKMLERKSGHIVNISSDAGRQVFAGLGVYSASKMFVEAISKALRLENVGSGLRVTSIQARTISSVESAVVNAFCSRSCAVRLGNLQPGNVATELVAHANAVSGVDAEAMKLYGEPSGHEVLKSVDVANAVVYAVTQPPYVAVNEVLVQPRDEPI
ncbi:TPA: hypothetical protein N0F65_001418 [Lagenidium giganteum]|uniref:NADP-dependent 3-hydroxy acid dehydrogenase YdfG n=1 Tax=Lagenidium giganteum TaxID=4803 RepID=A0AAV2YX90_9STRA|nr:TPA: hypothetical protein N0F65_001418 [Lagenidium giganteum]